MDGCTLTLAANPWNIARTYNLTPGRELLFACRYRLGTASNFVVYMSEADNVYDPLYGSFVGDQGAWSTAKMYFTAKLHFGAHFQAWACQPDGRNGGRLRPPDPGRNPGGRQHGEEDTAASAEARVPRRRGRRRHARKFSGALQQPELRGLGQLHCGKLQGYAMTLSALGWNVRTYTLTPGRRCSFGCRYRLGTASNLVMYVSAADNDYVGVTGTFLGTASQGVWSTARLASRRRWAESRSCTSERRSRPQAPLPDHAVVHRSRVRQLAEHQRRAELRQTASGAATAASFAATGALTGATLTITGALQEPGLHLYGHERRSVDGQRGVRRRDELGRSSSPPTRSP